MNRRVSVQEAYKRKLISVEGFAQLVKSGDNIATGLALGGVSPDLHNALLARADELENVSWGDAVQVRPSKLYDVETMSKLQGRINSKSFFVLATARKISQSKILDFIPVMGSDCAEIIYNWADVFAVMVSPPDKNGYVSFGLSNFFSSDVIGLGRKYGKIRTIVGEVNEQMPVINGGNFVHISEFDYFVENSSPIPVFGRGEPSAIEKTIGQYVLELIEDGDTIQMGIGMIPEAVIAGLDGKHDLGVHTEMVPMGLGELVEKGIVTNKKKVIHKGVTLATFCIGNSELYDYVANNRNVEFHPASYTNHPITIARNPNLVAINMGLLIDLTGQIVAEGYGHRQISGTGGQLDFAIGAHWSPGGKGITLITSARKLADGTMVSSIVPDLPAGSPITVPRHFANYVVTEYGIATLKGKSRRERAKALIAIAHPDLRAELSRQAEKAFYAD
ncbi:MAG: acetyl-CoA hydrolase/transferase family protein [Syntrophomonadaceae bacterium]|nr:acetyl-CoA hydrolase/transferase family protein [Syntrophomonadaceae bacterium]